MEAYVIQGPAMVGNRFGYYGHELDAADYLAVRDGEYNNGGCGPIAAGPLRATEAEARADAAAWTERNAAR